MTHRRTEIRRLTTERLKQALTVAGDQVYPGRFQPVHEEQIYKGGAIFVFTLEEAIPRRDRANERPHPGSNFNSGVIRDLDIEIHAITPAFQDQTPDTSDYSEDALESVDQLAAQIEQALEGWDPPGFESAFFRLFESKTEVTTLDGGMPVSVCRMTYRFAYMTPYRPCSDPLVDNESADMLLRGLYPGGQVIEGCPISNEGEVCPIPGEVQIQMLPTGAEVPDNLS